VRTVPPARHPPRRPFESTFRPIKRQFNVYLSPGLIVRVKLAALERGQTISAFVDEALETRLAPVEQPPVCTVPEDEQTVAG
jgi:hypothetical protein